MRRLSLIMLPALLVLASFVVTPARAAPDDGPVVLILTDGLSWGEVDGEPGLRALFEGGASANLSTSQGEPLKDPRAGYVFIGAGARVDTVALPDELPRSREGLVEAFTGATVRPGALGEALEDSGVKSAAVGGRAALVVMDREGRVLSSYDGSNPAAGLEDALDDGARFVAVAVEDPAEAAESLEVAEGAGATVAVASPNAPGDSAALTPVAISGERGLLYSPATRTTGLITNADVAPTLLSRLGIEAPPEMQGRPASVEPGDASAARSLGERVSFVAESRYLVWIFALPLLAVACAAGVLLFGRRSLRPALLSVAALPAGSLLTAAVPLSSVPVVVALTLAVSAALVAGAFRVSRTDAGAFAAVSLATAAVICGDAALGGPLMKFSTLGYDPVYGARFYGVGNELSALFAGSVTTGVGALCNVRRVPTSLLAAVGAAVVLVVGLPPMGADVGGSLALGFGFGATIGLLRRRGVGDLAAWTAGGCALALALFLSSGALFPDVSHGARAVSEQSGLWEMAVRKLLISRESLTALPLLLLFAAFALLIFSGWRRVRPTPLAAGILGASATALVSGVINDSGLVATLFVLLYPALASAMILLPRSGNGDGSHRRESSG